MKKTALVIMLPESEAALERNQTACAGWPKWRDYYGVFYL